LIFYTGYGQEISVSQQYYGHPRNLYNGAQFSLHTTSRDLEFAFIFNLEPVKAVEAVHQHIQFGKLLLEDKMNFILPPPAWAFGHHITLTPKF
jgi:hypothetical protein